MPIEIKEYIRLDTFEKIQIYVNKIFEWNERMNLVQEDTLKDIFNRHVIDSLQIIPIIQKTLKDKQGKFCDSDPMSLNTSSHPLESDAYLNYKFDDHIEDIRKLKVIDVGTGAGFPGMILAMCGLEEITLCDTNERKCIFLEEISRITNTKVQVVHRDIATVQEKYDYTLSRAYTSFKSLLKIAYQVSRTKESYGIFLKGKTWKSEIIEAINEWNFDIQTFQSITSTDGVIIACNNISKKM